MKRALTVIGVLGITIVGSLLFLQAEQAKPAKPKPVNTKADDVHDPANAVANLDVHPELDAQLFASEPMITNPINLDIDHRGRVWICDVVNYRHNNGKRPEGDRILILEDTNGDGKADTVKTFYQGRDVDSAMGICVLGNKLIVSATPNIVVFTFDENDKVTKKEMLFTKSGQVQHDHSLHSFLFGPDGKLYWNFGNTGGALYDKDGKPVVDIRGNVVAAHGKPYREGMPFRCNMDGSEFETLGWNFRNNYEVTVDSFGTLWQSDNDDDGNRGVRINFVMEYGNYGYKDEMTGASWQSPRTNMEKEIPLRHWHLNDPGVVPNFVQTGAGSPTGICVYEGELLPRVFQNQVIHCDAGPSIVRAYPATVDGAGYKGEIVNILDGAKKNKFFRPADVCTAPDGSLFVTDWYDPGVGGHHQGEIERGRIFRVLPKGHVNYDRPKFDFSNAESCVAALKNPALSVRYLAWDALHKMGTKAEPALSTLWKSDNSRHRARALWLLGKIEGRGSYWIEQALADKDSDIRITGLRLARQLKSDVIPIIEKLVSDKVPAVRRECAIALRHHQAEKAAKLWATLAHQHDGKDRWYLEALGIGADQQWDAFLKAYLEVEPSSAGRNDVLWRSRAQTTPKHLVSIISDKQTPTEDLPRYFRAFDFQAAREVKEEALTQLFTTDHGSDQARTNLIFSEVLNRLSGVNSKDPRFSKAMSKLVEQSKGTQQYVDLVGKFSLQGEYAGLLALAQKHADNQLGANAVKTLLDKGQTNLLKEALDDKDAKVTESTLLAIATSGDARPTVLLQSVITDAKRPIDQRRLAVRALAKSKPGAHEIIKLAQTKQLAKDLEQAAGAVLTTHADAAIRVEAVKLFPVPPGKNNQPIPPIPELVKLKGDIKNGKLLFAKEGTCANCHIVNGEGKEVGPNLSEIGKKLTKEALFESILFPSAAISHNFEMYVIETKSGNLVNGVLVSQTPEEVTIKRADAILQTLKKGEVLEFQKSSISLMPADLHKNLTGQDLSDIVEYLTTLKEAAKPSK